MEHYRECTGPRTSPPSAFPLCGREQDGCKCLQCEGKSLLVSRPGDYICLQLQDVSLAENSFHNIFKEQQKKKVLNSWLNSIYIFHFFFLLWFFTKLHFDMPLKENSMCMSNRFKRKKKLIYRATQRIQFGRSNRILCSGRL